MHSQLDRYRRIIGSMLPGTAAVDSTFDLAGILNPPPRQSHRALLLYSGLRHPIAHHHREPILRAIDGLNENPWQWLIRRRTSETFGIPNWREESRRQFRSLIDQQRSNGALLPLDPAIHPETRWYDELVTLHALTNFAMIDGDPCWNAAIERAARFHLEETQPDHGSTEPWALLAFIQHAPPLADQMLHAVTIQYPAGPTGVPLLLLADALYGLRRKQELL